MCLQKDLPPTPSSRLLCLSNLALLAHLKSFSFVGAPSTDETKFENYPIDVLEILHDTHKLIVDEEEDNLKGSESKKSEECPISNEGGISV